MVAEACALLSRDHRLPLLTVTGVLSTVVKTNSLHEVSWTTGISTRSVFD